jgi:hypothetical protein
MNWWIAVPVGWLAVAPVLGLLVANCIRMAAGEDTQPPVPADGRATPALEQPSRRAQEPAGARRTGPMTRQAAASV